MQFNNFRLGQRLGIGFGLLIALLVGLVGLAYNRLASLESEMQRVSGLERQANLADQWRAMTLLNASRAIAIAQSGNMSDVATYFAPLMKQTSAVISGSQKELTEKIDSPQGKEMLATIGQRRTDYVGIRKQVIAKLDSGDTAGGQDLLKNGMLPAADQYVKALEVLSTFQRERADAAVADAQSSAQRAEWLMVGLLAVGVVAAVGVGVALTRSLTGPLRRAVEQTQAIAAGDLTHEIHVEGQDEIAELQRSLSTMQSALQGLIGAVKASSDSIGTASAQIASGNADLGSRTEQAASHLQQTASSVEEIAGTVGQTADSARTADQLASSASEVARRGGQVVSQVVATMQEINSSSQKIADIIGVIDGIAFQTNILALNAAVEAARAGEQGRGFAVVASEVRSLAGRSAEAAREIKALIGTSVDKVEAGSRLVSEAGQTMEEIVSSVQRVSDIIGEISSAAGEQSAGMRQLNTAINELDRSTQQNAALVEESTAAAISLREQAQRLIEEAGHFRVDGHHAPAAATAAPAAPRVVPATRPAVAQPVAAKPAAARPAATSPAATAPKAPAAEPAPPKTAAQPVQATTGDDDWETF